MKGIVFNLLEELVRRDFGEDTWDDLLDAAQVDGAYTSLGSYPDTDLQRLVTVASQRLRLSPETIVRWLGRESIPVLAARYPGFFRPHTETSSFLLSLNDIIHPEVRKLYPGADVPVFDFDLSHAPEIRMRYDSHRRMCSFAEGLIEGSAHYFREQVEMHQASCMHRGDTSCHFHIRFSPGVRAPASAGAGPE